MKWASGISVAGKFATQFSTSKHFYDVTAHYYIQDNCQDLGLKYIRGLSADMDDLLTEKGRKEAMLKMYLIGALLSSPRVRAKIGGKMNEGMIAPYKKVLEEASKYK